MGSRRVSGFTVQGGSGFRAFRVLGSRFRVLGLGSRCRVQPSRAAHVRASEWSSGPSFGRSGRRACRCRRRGCGGAGRADGADEHWYGQSRRLTGSIESGEERAARSGPATSSKWRTWIWLVKTSTWMSPAMMPSMAADSGPTSCRQTPLVDAELVDDGAARGRTRRPGRCARRSARRSPAPSTGKHLQSVDDVRRRQRLGDRDAAASRPTRRARRRLRPARDDTAVPGRREAHS